MIVRIADLSPQEEIFAILSFLNVQIVERCGAYYICNVPTRYSYLYDCSSLAAFCFT